MAELDLEMRLVEILSRLNDLFDETGDQVSLEITKAELVDIVECIEYTIKGPHG